MNLKENQRFSEELEVRALDEDTRKAYRSSIGLFLSFHHGTANSLLLRKI